MFIDGSAEQSALLELLQGWKYLVYELDYFENYQPKGDPIGRIECNKEGRPREATPKGIFYQIVGLLLSIKRSSGL